VADFIRTPMQLCDAELPVATLLDGLQRQTFVPHVLVTREGKVQGVLSSRRIVHMLRRGNRAGTAGEHARPTYAVVNAQDLIFDVLARLREHGGDIALLTREGKLEGVDDVTGIVTWNDILLNGNIPLPLRRRRRPEAQRSAKS
jgi:CBS domain containing-hemolysin-like protein